MKRDLSDSRYVYWWADGVLAFKLVQEAEKSWRRIHGYERIAELMGGVLFKDGEPVKEEEQEQQQRLAA
jgi:hypothetical protein